MQVQPQGSDSKVRARRSVASRWKRACTSTGLWSIGGVVVVAVLALNALDAHGGSEQLLSRLGLFAMVPLILVHAVASVSPFPGELVAFGNSMLFGFWLGVVCNWCGWMIGAVLQYWLARRTTSDLNLDASGAWRRAPKWLRSMPLDHPLFLIGGRWLPFGAHLVNTTAGVLRVPFWRHAWCSAISILPVAAIVAALGSGVVQSLSLQLGGV